jgi:hypothetical protein
LIPKIKGGFIRPYFFGAVFAPAAAAARGTGNLPLSILTMTLFRKTGAQNSRALPGRIGFPAIQIIFMNKNISISQSLVRQ